MWLLTNMESGKQLLFSTVDSYCAFVEAHRWSNYNVRFIEMGEDS